MYCCTKEKIFLCGVYWFYSSVDTPNLKPNSVRCGYIFAHILKICLQSELYSSIFSRITFFPKDRFTYKISDMVKKGLIWFWGG